jgi:hypothetical protein
MLITDGDDGADDDNDHDSNGCFCPPRSIDRCLGCVTVLVDRSRGCVTVLVDRYPGCAAVLIDR